MLLVCSGKTKHSWKLLSIPEWLTNGKLVSCEVQLVQSVSLLTRL